LPGAICVWPAGSWIPTWRRRAGDGPLQQTFEKTLKAWLQHIGIKPPHSHDIARLLVLLDQDGVDVRELLALRAFTTFAVQGRYDDEPEELGLDRIAWCQRAEALIEHVQNLLG
jgi:HEPN domain-containing protein